MRYVYVLTGSAIVEPMVFGSAARAAAEFVGLELPVAYSSSDLVFKVMYDDAGAPWRRVNNGCPIIGVEAHIRRMIKREFFKVIRHGSTRLTRVRVL